MTASHDDITDLFTDRDRMLIAAWMLPTEGPLTDAQRRQAMGNFRRYLSRAGVSIDQVAHQLGIAKADMLNLWHDLYHDSADDHVRKLNLWVEQHARSSVTRLARPFVTTKVAKALLTSAKLVSENRTIGLCFGPTGIGKSRCAQAIHETYVGSILLRVMYGYHHPRGLTRALFDRLALRRCRSSWQLESVIDALKDSHRLLILDEAHKLTSDTLELVRDIYDTTGIPILMIATKDLYDRILQSAGPDRGQLYSRFDIVQHITEGYDLHSGGKPLFTIAEIRELYEQKPIRLSPDAGRYLQSIANDLGHGSLRRCWIVLTNAVRRARKRQGIDESQKVTVMADDLTWVEGILRQVNAEQTVAHERRRRVASSGSGRA